MNDHAFEPAADDGLRFAHDAGDQFDPGRDFLDQALDLARRPDAFVRVAGRVDHLAAGARDEFADVLELGAFLLHRYDLGRDLVPGDAGGVAHGAEHQLGFALVIGHDLLLDELMNGALFGRHEARAHVDAFGAQRQCGDEAAGVGKAAGGDHRDLDLVGGGRDQDQAGGVVLAGMTGAFEPVDRDGVDAHALGREPVTDAGAFVHDLDAVLPELVDVLLRLVAGSFDHLDAALDDSGAIFGIRGRLDWGEDGEVDAKRLVGEIAAAGDLLPEVLRCRLGQRRDEAERAGIGDGGDQLGAPDPLHAALDDRVLDSDELGEPCLQHDLFPRLRGALLSVDAGRMPPGSGKVYCEGVRWRRGDHAGSGGIP